jgi:hypothetical protein
MYVYDAFAYRLNISLIIIAFNRLVKNINKLYNKNKILCAHTNCFYIFVCAHIKTLLITHT